MNYKSKTKKALTCLLITGMVLGMPSVSSYAAVITSNATDKVAVVFNENTAYSAGDYITHEGEMYICTDEIQGAWSIAKDRFLQITKNHELGRSEELSAAYDEGKDPSEETSLMAFAANAWQKLKVFLGIGSGQQETDAGHYKESSVSAKLNYLEQQNQTLTQNLSNLQGSVNNSFTSVSNGKNLLANAIIDKGGTASSSYTFQEFSQAIDNLVQAKYQEGITYADGRVNKDSESYKQGASESSLKHFSDKIVVNYDGPDCYRQDFILDVDGDTHTWSFRKSFEGHTIVGVYCRTYLLTFYDSANVEQMGTLTSQGFRFVPEVSQFSYSVSGGTVYLGDFEYPLGVKDYKTVTLWLDIVYI